MAQLLFDALTGGISSIDSQTVLAVQSFFESGEEIATETVPTLDEEDVFQCGKCKKQFTSLNLFMNHKKVQCIPVTISENGSVTCLPTSINVSSSTNSNPGANILVVKGAVPNPGANYTLATANNRQGSTLNSLVLSETDLLSLTLDRVGTLPSLQSVSSSSIQNPTNTIKTTEPITVQGLTSPSLVSNLGLSLLGNSFPGLILASQGTEGSTNLYLTIAGPPAIEKEEAAPLAEVKIKNTHSTKAVETTKNSLVNVITDFTHNVVKPKKKIRSKEHPSTSASGSEGGIGSTEPSSKKGFFKALQSQKMKCTFCDKSFNKNFDLQQHIRSHTGEKPFQCIICGRAFAQKSNVKKHIQTHKVWPDGLSSTLPCVVTTNTDKPQDENENPKSDTNSKSDTCAIVSLDEEENMSQVDNSYVCPYCKYAGKTYFDLKGHMKQHKNKKVYKCIVSTCAQMYEDLDAFLDHVKSHESEMTYRCHLCNKTFQGLYDLGVHQYSHSLYPNDPNGKSSTTDKMSFRCVSCLNKYSTETALEHHLATCSHNYTCPHCNKSFPCERYLRRHLQVHNNRSRFTCSICSKTFKAEHYLRVHKVIHTSEKPHICRHCGNAFNRRDKLKRHLLIHEPSKKFKCPFHNHTGCEKEFSRPDKLKAHVLTHCQGKPFLCGTCGRVFTRKAQLKTHQQQHKEEKDFPFYCSKCSSGFLNKDVFDSHVCVQYSTHRWRIEYRSQRTGRSRRTKFSVLRSRKKLKKPLPEIECTPDEPLLEDDGIPTAHIEIISTTGDLNQVRDLSQISLKLHPLVEAGNQETGQNSVVQNIPLVIKVAMKETEMKEFMLPDNEKGDVSGL